MLRLSLFHSDKPLGFCNKVFEIKNQEINNINENKSFTVQ